MDRQTMLGAYSAHRQHTGFGPDTGRTSQISGQIVDHNADAFA
jgi:hypothetical protein